LDSKEGGRERSGGEIENGARSLAQAGGQEAGAQRGGIGDSETKRGNCQAAVEYERLVRGT
jgi:hypothetical protein